MVGNDSEAILVGVAEYAITGEKRPLRTSGVGSCGVVAVHDAEAAVSGLLHFMLPSADPDGGPGPAAKFGDAGIDALFAEFEAAGGEASRAWGKLAGGAEMIGFDSFDRPIGDQNVETARTELQERGVPIRGADVGGDVGRRVTFDPSTGELRIKTADGERRRR